jgi:hypothetical protein
MVSYYPFNGDRLTVVRGFRSEGEARRWIDAEALEDYADDLMVDFYREYGSPLLRILPGKKEWRPD